RQQVKLRNSYLTVWKNVADPGILACSTRTWLHQVRQALGGERWMLKPLREAATLLPAALASRRRHAPYWRVPDTEFLPRFVPGRVRAGLGRGTPFPGDLFEPPGARRP